MVLGSSLSVLDFGVCKSGSSFRLQTIRDNFFGHPFGEILDPLSTLFQTFFSNTMSYAKEKKHQYYELCKKKEINLRVAFPCSTSSRWEVPRRCAPPVGLEAVTRFTASHIGSTMSLRGYMRVGSALSVYGLCRLGSSFSVLDFAHMGSTVSLRQFARLGSSISVYGLSRLGPQSHFASLKIIYFRKLIFVFRSSFPEILKSDLGIGAFKVVEKVLVFPEVENSIVGRPTFLVANSLSLTCNFRYWDPVRPFHTRLRCCISSFLSFNWGVLGPPNQWIPSWIVLQNGGVFAHSKKHVFCA